MKHNTKATRRLCALLTLLLLALCLIPSAAAQVVSLPESATVQPLLVAASDSADFPVGENLLIALVVGLIVALITVTVMRSKLKSVRARNEASEYTRPGSMNVTESRDLYLYRHVTRRAKPKQNKSSR